MPLDQVPTSASNARHIPMPGRLVGCCSVSSPDHPLGAAAGRLLLLSLSAANWEGGRSERLVHERHSSCWAFDSQAIDWSERCVKREGCSSTVNGAPSLVLTKY